MREETACLLNELNAHFYATVHKGFSDTRQNAWPGWERVLTALALNGDLGGNARELRVLDVACGNLRFEKFLTGRTGRGFELFAVDNCPQLASDTQAVHFAEIDVIGELLKRDTGLEKALSRAFELDRPSFDLVASFGFMHHIPGFDRRLLFLRQLMDLVCEGGHVVVALWRFLDSEKLAAKARVTHKKAQKHFADRFGESGAQTLLDDLEPNDWFLGWADSENAYRYCHHFEDEEVSSLVAELAQQAELVDDFLADGKTGTLNRYLIFRKRGLVEATL